ncbi:uroporphyrinogen-III C-methyltransferase [Alicyclobacillus fodiniaquatilis]|jgi:uroporphyrinogen III methyltransferase/synthase|uniref:uroporphyrinogen-III C-methyltransferase n=1 Tax=Alicyclobacillus fodiniaquatilis TaxID=1661150 RepID=A0ABW4JBQ4_9BACL
MANGTVYLVGAGPGDAGLITLKGRRCLERADAIVYDRLASPRLLSMARPDVELHYVGKAAEDHTMPQEDIERLLIRLARRGLNVVRLKGGDPFVFGRGGEEAKVLTEAGIAWEVVPGITSAVSVPAYAGIPVTYRNVSPGFTVVTGHRCVGQDDVEWETLAATGETLVVLMGVRQLDGIVQSLVRAGKRLDTPVALIRWGTRAAQATLVGTLENIVEQAEQARFRAPAVIVIGDVVKAREALSWYECLPLMGRRILVAASTRAQAEEMAQSVEAQGAEALAISVEQLAAPDNLQLDALLQQLVTSNGPTGLYFQSALGLSYFFRRMKTQRLDVRKLHAVSFAVANERLGEQLQTYGLFADAIGAKALQVQDGIPWWVEANTFQADTAKIGRVQTFAAYELASSSSWLALAQAWLDEGPVEAAWSTADAAPLLTDLLGLKLPSDTRRISFDEDEGHSSRAQTAIEVAAQLSSQKSTVVHAK